MAQGSASFAASVSHSLRRFVVRPVRCGPSGACVRPVGPSVRSIPPGNGLPPAYRRILHSVGRSVVGRSLGPSAFPAPSLPK